jgi:hypothetical protein
MSLTYDEGNHWLYGLQILSLNSNRLFFPSGKIDDSKMPMTALNAIPAKIGQLLPPGKLQDSLEHVNKGRWATIGFSMLIALLVYHWSNKLYGIVPAIFSLFLYVFEPNISAHSQLVTTDVYIAGMIAISTFALWRYSQSPCWKRALFLALAMGVSQLAKYTAISLYPLFAVILLVRDVPDLRDFIKARDLHALWSYFRRQALLAGLIVLVSLLVINMGYFFNRTFTRFGDYKFKFDTFRVLQSKYQLLDKVPVPLPYPYLQGLDLITYNERTGESRGPNYLFGQLSKQGFPGYYFVAWLYKVPISVQVAFLGSILLFLARRKERRFLQNEWFLIGPILFYTVYLNFFNNAQIGIRYLLVVFPLILVFCGNLMLGWQVFRTIHWAAIGLLAVYLLISVFSYFPHYISYFNELVPDRRMAYQILADSNLDWDQSRWYLGKYLEAHPKAKYDPEMPVTGTVVVGVNDLVGIKAYPGTY